MDKKEIEIQKALGTIKRKKYKISFTYCREELPGKLFYYSKNIMAYSYDEATKKIMIAFVKDPMLKKDKYVSHKPFKNGDGFFVRVWDQNAGKKGAWITISK